MNQSSSQKNCTFAGFRYDEHSASIVDRDGLSIKLRPQTVEVFRVLAESPDRLVTRESLLNTVWSGIHVTDDSLTKCVSEIRNAIGDDNHAVLQTVPKRGYILVKESQSPNHSVAAEASSTNSPNGDLLTRRNIGLKDGLHKNGVHHGKSYFKSNTLEQG